MNTEPEDENLAIEEMFRLNEIEKSWRKTLPKSHDSIWIEAFPEAREIIPLKIQEWQERYDQISNSIKQKLINLEKITKDDFCYWFFREWIKVNEGEKLVEAKKHIKRLKWLIVDKSKLSSDSIDQNDIQRAKEVPLIEVG